MKRIIIEEDNCDTIRLSDTDENKPIFAKHNGKFIGMIVREDKGWILRLGGSSGATGYHNTLYKCLLSCNRAREDSYYTFFV